MQSRKAKRAKVGEGTWELRRCLMISRGPHPSSTNHNPEITTRDRFQPITALQISLPRILKIHPDRAVQIWSCEWKLVTRFTIRSGACHSVLAGIGNKCAGTSLPGALLSTLTPSREKRVTKKCNKKKRVTKKNLLGKFLSLFFFRNFFLATSSSFSFDALLGRC